MATIDWPDALVPQTAQLTLRKAGSQFASPFNGTLQAVDFVGERWALSCSLAQMASRNPRGVGAFCNTLAGGVERVRVWPFHTRGAPRGTLRGAPVLGVAAARGNASLTLANCTGHNMLLGGSFEVDTNSDGVADGWSLSAGGTGDSGRLHTASVTSAFGAVHGAFSQTVTITAVGNTIDSVLWSTNMPIKASTAYTLSAHLNCTTPNKAWVGVRQYTAAMVVTGADAVSAFAGTAGMLQRTVNVITQPDAAFANVMVRGINAVGETMRVDAVQFELGSVATPFSPGPTLLAGDFIGVGGQLFQVAADCQANSAGVMTVPVVNRVRGTIASGSAVTWHRPSCEMVLPAMQAGPVWRPGAIDSTALDLMEVW